MIDPSVDFKFFLVNWDNGHRIYNSPSPACRNNSGLESIVYLPISAESDKKSVSCIGKLQISKGIRLPNKPRSIKHHSTTVMKWHAMDRRGFRAICRRIACLDNLLNSQAVQWLLTDYENDTSDGSVPHCLSTIYSRLYSFL